MPRRIMLSVFALAVTAGAAKESQQRAQGDNDGIAAKH